jgi:uncharacterized membrane protein
MQRSRMPHGGWNDVYHSGDGSLSQVLTETVVSEALSRESGRTRTSRGRKDVLSGLKTAVLWCAVFWALVYGAVSLIL